MLVITYICSNVNLNIYFKFYVCLYIHHSVFPFVCVSENFLYFLQLCRKMSQIKDGWYVLRVKNMHPVSPSDPSCTAAEQGEAELRIFEFKTTWSEFQTPSQTTLAEAKPRCVYSILKPHDQSSRYQVRILFRVSSPPQSRSKAVVCVSTPRMYPRSGYFLVI